MGWGSDLFPPDLGGRRAPRAGRSTARTTRARARAQAGSVAAGGDHGLDGGLLVIAPAGAAAGGQQDGYRQQRDAATSGPRWRTSIPHPDPPFVSSTPEF